MWSVALPLWSFWEVWLSVLPLAPPALAPRTGTPLTFPQPGSLADLRPVQPAQAEHPGSARGANPRLCFAGYPAESCAAHGAVRAVAYHGAPPSYTKVL